MFKTKILKFVVLLFVVILIFILAFKFLYLSKRKGEKDNISIGMGKLPRIKCVGAVVKEGFIFPYISGTGKAYPLKSELFISKVDGKVKYFKKQEGEKVRKGELLLAFECEDLEIRKKQLEIERRIFLNFLRTLDTSLNRQRDTNLADIENVDYLKTISEIAKVNYELKKRVIYAPFDGVIGYIKVKENQYVSYGDTLFFVFSPDTFGLNLEIFESDIHKVKIGQKVILIYPYKRDLKFFGKVVAISPIVRDGKVLVKVIFKNEGNFLKSGSFLEAKICIDSIKFSKIVPKSAVVDRGGNKVVFKYRGGRVEWVYVKILAEDDKNCAVEGKISPGDTVIIKGNEFLSDKTEVELLKCIN